jgi:hypothetical protein
VSRRQGVIGKGREIVERLPAPASSISEVTAEVRVFWPPNATYEQILSAIMDARHDAIRQIRDLRGPTT